MKKTTAIIAIALLGLIGCTSIKNVGSLNMVSTRNIDVSAKYGVIQKYTELTKREKKRSKAENIQEAVDALVKKVDGGEYVMNARIYLVKHDYFIAYSYYYAVDGDVWGKK